MTSNSTLGRQPLMDTHYISPPQYLQGSLKFCIQLVYACLVYIILCVVLLRSDAHLDTTLMYTQRSSTQPKYVYIYLMDVNPYPYCLIFRQAAAAAVEMIYHTLIVLVYVCKLCMIICIYCACMLEWPHTSSSQNGKVTRQAKTYQ